MDGERIDLMGKTDKTDKEGKIEKIDSSVSLTFDDILLIPQYSELNSSQVLTESHFARDLFLKSPIISAAMDTVTENQMAIAMAQRGGLGVIHKNMSIESHCFQVEKVKKYESGLIVDPITVSPDQLISEALDIMKKHSVSGFPVTVDGVLVGILTHRDLRFEDKVDQPISNVMTKENLVTTPEGTTLEEAKRILQRHRIEKLLVVDGNKNLKGLITIKDIEKSKTFPDSSKDHRGRLLVGAAVGVGGVSVNRVDALVASGVDLLVVDTAHGHSKNVIDIVEYIRSRYKDIILVAGNVVTAEGTEVLIKKGVDVVKVGVGPGSICTTRIVTGVGVPQVSAVLNCSKVAKRLGRSIIADGGIKFSGDVTKALALGANSVMVGSILAGADESPGETVLYQGRTYKVYRGMGSLGAMPHGSKDRYFQGEVTEYEKLVPEGIEGRVPYKGSASAILHQLVGGLKSGMGYLGASSIDELQAKAKFIRMSPQGLRESHVHDVNITKEAPNYRLE